MATITFKHLGGELYVVANRESYEVACTQAFGPRYKREHDLPALNEGTTFPCIIHFGGNPSHYDGCLAHATPLETYRKRLQNQLDAVKDF